MDTLAGHILPGSIFLMFALWWMWSILHRFFICKKEMLIRSSSSYKKKKLMVSKYKNTASFLCAPLSCRRFHLEAIFKVSLTTVGIIGELATAFRDGKFVNLGNSQHIVMYFFYTLNGIFDLLQYHGCNLVPDMDYITALMAIAVEAFLFSNHLKGRSPLDIQIHIFLVLALIITLIFGFGEMKYRTSVLPALGRTFFFLLQGTWFFQVGFILYPPNGNTWDEESHASMMIATVIFTGHIAGIFVFMTIATIVIYFRVKRMNTTTMEDIVYPYISMKSTPGKSFDFSSDQEEPIIKNDDVDTDEEIL